MKRRLNSEQSTSPHHTIGKAGDRDSKDSTAPVACTHAEPGGLGGWLRKGQCAVFFLFWNNRFSIFRDLWGFFFTP